MDATVKYPIRFGDRIFVRVMMLGRAVRELTLENVASFTDVIGEIRHALGDLRGLVVAIVRNYHRGWSVDRPMMLYGRSRGPQGGHRDGGRDMSVRGRANRFAMSAVRVSGV